MTASVEYIIFTILVLGILIHETFTVGFLSHSDSIYSLHNNLGYLALLNASIVRITQTINTPALPALNYKLDYKNYSNNIHVYVYSNKQRLLVTSPQLILHYLERTYDLSLL